MPHQGRVLAFEPLPVPPLQKNFGKNRRQTAISFSDVPYYIGTALAAPRFVAVKTELHSNEMSKNEMTRERSGRMPSPRIRLNPTKSDQIRVNPSNFLLGCRSALPGAHEQLDEQRAQLYARLRLFGVISGFSR